MYLEIIHVWGVEVPDDIENLEEWAHEYVRGHNPDNVQIERIPDDQH